ncbi:NADH:flavin oxidoreductase [Streptomyces sp. NPDC051940]|uniref:NADH:flavin oxidoreductase n=1 Tax=Streptomyces sp. NPDC051940 TaxID=3155675 RepID=UPI00342E093E
MTTERTPSRSTGGVPGVFAPGRLGPVRLRNRVVKAATFEGVTPDALVTDELIEYHLRPARGGVAMTTVAYCAVAPEGRTQRAQLWMRPEALPGLRRLTEAVHGTGAAVALQLGHAGPVADARSNGLPALSPMGGFNPVSLRRDRAATAEDLEGVVRAHASAARLAVDAGADAVELHLGHNYLASAFLSPRLNRRTDTYGGPLANRARLALDLARAVRDEVGDRIAITAKLNMTDGVRGGLTVQDSLQVARWLQEQQSVDALTLTAGSSLLNPMYLFRGDAPSRSSRHSSPGRNAWACAHSAAHSCVPICTSPCTCWSAPGRFARRSTCPWSCSAASPTRRAWTVPWPRASTSSPWPVPCCANPTWCSASPTTRPPTHAASTATAACPPSTPAPTAPPAAEEER